MNQYEDRPRGAKALYFDTETIPTQREDVAREIRDGIYMQHAEELAAEFDRCTVRINDETVCRPDFKHEQVLFRIEEEVRQAIHATCLDGAFGQLAVISLAADDDDPTNLWDANWDAPGYEAWLLHELHEITSRACGKATQLVGHHIAFDRDIVRQRAIVTGMPAHWMFTREVKPWETAAVFCTMAAWTGDFRKRIKQDKLCKALGIDGKGTDLDDGEYIDGSMVWDFIKRGEIAKVATYCGGDVVRARRLHHRLIGRTGPAVPPVLFTPGLPRAQAGQPVPAGGAYVDVPDLEP